MKGKKLVWVAAALGFLLIIQIDTLLAQKTGKTLSVIYSNNINGEVDPCPT
jgi:hypothetical protein